MTISSAAAKAKEISDSTVIIVMIASAWLMWLFFLALAALGANPWGAAFGASLLLPVVIMAGVALVAHLEAKRIAKRAAMWDAQRLEDELTARIKPNS